MILETTDSDAIHISVIEEQFGEGGEVGHIDVPNGFEFLSADRRASLVLEAVHGVVRRLGELRGWDLRAIDRARDGVIAGGYRYSWTGPWKSSPNRKKRVRLRAELPDDGCGRLHFEFALRGEDEPYLVADVIAGSQRRSFARVAKSIKWASDDEITAYGQMVWAIEINAVTGAVRVDTPWKKPRSNTRVSPLGAEMFVELIDRPLR